MALTSADIQAVAKAVWALHVTSAQTGKTYPAAGFLTSASHAADLTPAIGKNVTAILGSGQDDAAMQALVIKALQSPAGQAAIKKAVSS